MIAASSPGHRCQGRGRCAGHFAAILGWFSPCWRCVAAPACALLLWSASSGRAPHFASRALLSCLRLGFTPSSSRFALPSLLRLLLPSFAPSLPRLRTSFLLSSSFLRTPCPSLFSLPFALLDPFAPLASLRSSRFSSLLSSLFVSVPSLLLAVARSPAPRSLPSRAGRCRRRPAARERAPGTVRTYRPSAFSGTMGG